MVYEPLSAYCGKSILITGGLGFIGSNLARALIQHGSQVTLVDNLIPQYGGNPFNIEDIQDRVTVNISDVRDSFSIEYLVQGKDILFNLAGQTSHIDSMNNPKEDLDINATAQLTILEACKKVNPSIKIVYASTRQLYGRPDYLPVNELHPIRPVDINGINKFAGEWYHMLYNKIYGLNSCSLRLTNTYGPRMRVIDSRQTFLGIWIRLLLEGKPIQVFGDGMQLRDFNYVDDTVEALLLSGISDISNGKIYNLGSAEVVSLKTLAQMMIQFVEEGRFELVSFPSDRKVIDIGDFYSDFSFAKADLGWYPKTDLNLGLKRTIEFYQKNYQHYW